MFIILFRTIILYSLVVISMRIMGKRQIGQLQPFELVVAIMISDLASLPMQDTRIPLINGIIPIVSLLFLQVSLSKLQTHSDTFIKLLDGKPTILIEHGKILESNLINQRFTIRDLLEELRISGHFNVRDIEYAILETSGKLSIIPKESTLPPTRKDLNIQSKTLQYPIILITNGEISKASLKYISKNEEWLQKLVLSHKIESIKDVFIGMLDSEKNFFYQLKEKRK